MGLVLWHKGDASGAGREFEAAMRYWRDADPDLPESGEIAALDLPEKRKP